jgi:hypothetical protein
MLLCADFVFVAANDELCPCSIGSRVQPAFLYFWERSIVVRTVYVFCLPSSTGLTFPSGERCIGRHCGKGPGNFFQSRSLLVSSSTIM